MIKAWFVTPKDEDYGYLIHAETRGKAIYQALKYAEYFHCDRTEFTHLQARRFPKMDDKRITFHNALAAGIEMRSEDGDKITPNDFENICWSPLCRLCRKGIQG
jgi:hypothetical protein